LILITDSREQNPIRFEHFKTDANIEYVIVDKLCYGDYSAVSGDKTCQLFFERKSLGDLFGTLGKGYSRFKKEIARCNLDGNKLVIIIEGTLRDVLNGHKHSQMSGIGIIRTMCTLQWKYGVQFVCCSSREEMALYIIEQFSAWERNMV